MRRALALGAVLLPFVVGFASTSASAPAGPDDEIVFTFRDPQIIESSGLVARDGLFSTVNDSGDAGRLFTVDPADGSTVAVTSFGDATDVEALAPEPDGRVLVGDIGDNDGVRDSVRLLSVPLGRIDRDVEPTTYDVTYDSGPQDAETLLVHPRTGRVLIVTKGLFGGRIMALPSDEGLDGELDPDRLNEMHQVGEALAVATDGAFFADGRHFLVRGYTRAALYTYPGLEQVAAFDLPEQQQGEGLAIDERGRVFLSSEGRDSDVLRVRLPPRVERLATSSQRAGSASGPSQPVTGPQPDVSGMQWPWLVGGIALVVIAACAVVLVVLLAWLLVRRVRRGASSSG